MARQPCKLILKVATTRLLAQTVSRLVRFVLTARRRTATPHTRGNSNKRPKQRQQQCTPRHKHINLSRNMHHKERVQLSTSGPTLPHRAP